MASAIPAGSPVWIDMTSSDFPAAQAFYQQLFGWKFEDVGNYHIFSLDGHPLGSLTASDPKHQPAYSGAADRWTVFLHSDNLQHTITRALAAGGEVLLPDTTVHDWGRFAVLADPDRAIVGVWQSGTHTGFDHRNEQRGSVAHGYPCWFEIMNRKFAESIEFYRSAFHWNIHRVIGEWNYATNAPQESATCGLGDITGVFADDAPAWFRVYFQVDNVDAAVTTVRKLGGTLDDGPTDSPYGRIATVADPCGAKFQILETTRG